MGGVTVYETFDCGYDCDGWGGSCKGHSACLIYRSSSDTYEFQIDTKEDSLFSAASLAVFLTLARRIEATKAASVSYVPDGYVLVPVVPTQEMLDAGWDAEDHTADVPTVWQAMLAARPEVP